MTIPEREIRAFFGPDTIRVYQAYSDAIADSALKAQTLVSPPFSMTRMTWIKPSFLWMMYRSGWGKKDSGQKRILAIDIKHEGFKWALDHSAPSHPEPGMSDAEWRQRLANSPVRVQWDPERDPLLNQLPYRSIQIGLSGEAVDRYVQEWIVAIADLTQHVQFAHSVVESGDLRRASLYLPRERVYEVGMTRRRYIEIERERLLKLDHQDHEDILRFLQGYGEDDEVPYLRKAIQLKPALTYLAYDDYGAFYKKCLWVLQDIGTPDALALIRECASSPDTALKTQAEHRLKRIAEGGRGGTQFPRDV